MRYQVLLLVNPDKSKACVEHLSKLLAEAGATQKRILLFRPLHPEEPTGEAKENNFAGEDPIVPEDPAGTSL